MQFVNVDEFAFPPKAGISCLVNGEVRQDSDTRCLNSSFFAQLGI